MLESFPPPTSGNQFAGAVSTPTNLKEEVVELTTDFTGKFPYSVTLLPSKFNSGYAISRGAGQTFQLSADTFGNPSFSALCIQPMQLARAC